MEACSPPPLPPSPHSCGSKALFSQPWLRNVGLMLLRAVLRGGRAPIEGACKQNAEQVSRWFPRGGQ